MGEKIPCILDGKKIHIKISDKALKELEEVKKKVNKMIQPLYDELGVDIDTEELHWTNGEVFVINKKTRERRDIKGKTQPELNKRLLSSALELSERGGKEDEKRKFMEHYS